MKLSYAKENNDKDKNNEIIDIVKLKIEFISKPI